MNLWSLDLLVLYVYLDIIKICYIIVFIYYIEVIILEKNFCNVVGKIYLDINIL